MEIIDNLKKKIYLSAILLLCGLFSFYAQARGGDELSKNEKKYRLREVVRINMGFSGLGISYEKPLKYNFILESEIGLGAGYKINQNFKYRCRFDDPSFYASLSGKYYYILDGPKRKNVFLNKGNFWGFKTKYTSKSLKDKQMWNTLLVASHWGIQRQLYKRLTFQLTMGIGAAIDLEGITDTYVTVYPDFNFKISYALPF